MAVGYNPKAVTDGLVLALDAANTKSYSGSGSTWSDLSGNSNNGTIVGATNSASAVGWDIPNISQHATTTHFDSLVEQATFIRDNGIDIFILDYYGVIYHYQLGSAFNFSSITSIRSLDVKGTSGTGFSASAQDFRDFTFSPDGLNVYVRGDDSSIRISQFSLATAFDLSSTKTHVGNFTAFPSAINDSRSVRFANSGSILMLGGNNVDHRFGISQLSTPYNITTVSSTTVYDLADDFSYTDESNYWVHASNYSSDGKKLIISSVYGYDLIYIQLSTAFDPSSNTSTNTYSSDSISDLYFISDGSKAISQRNASNVRIYNTGTPASDVVPGTYFDFNGTDDYAQLSASSDLNFGTGNFTIEGWFNKDATTGNQALVCSNKYYINGNNGNWILRISSATQIAFAAYDGTGGEQYQEFSASTSVNTWHHFALVREGTGSSQTKFYLDGVLKGSMTLSKSLTDAGTNGLRIGEESDSGPGNAPFNGKISNIKIYKGKALTLAEIEQNFNAFKGRFGL